MEFRFAILGAGRIARKFADAVRRVEGGTVAAVAGKSAERANAFARDNGIPVAYDDYDAMLRAVRPDCAYIATTCDSHFELSMLCVARGVPVLCEKAMFTGEAQARTFFDAAREKGVFSMEALWSNFLPANLKAREWLRAGRIGELVCADFDIGFAAPRDVENRYFSPALGGGAANDLTVYPLHLLPWLTQRRVEEMRATVVPASTGVDETESLLLRLAGGVPATVRSTLAARMEERVELCGTKGRIVIPKPHMAVSAFLFDADGREAERFEDARTENGFVYEVEEAMGRIREGALESPVVPHDATLRAARYIGALHDMLRGE